MEDYRLKWSIPLPVMVLIAAICFHMISRIGRGMTPPEYHEFGRPLMTMGEARARYRIKILFVARFQSGWRDTIWQFVRHAHAPRGLQFCILLECESVRDAEAEVDIEPELRPLTRLIQVRAKDKPQLDPARTLRRLTRRFVDGGETAVLFVDPRIRVVPNWDASVAQLLKGAPSNTVLSVPAFGKLNVAAFPTRRKRSTGTIARGDAKLFYTEERAVGTEYELPHTMIPSVCWCAEFTATAPATLLGGWPKKCATFAAVEHTASIHSYVATFPLVERNTGIEDDYFDADEGCEEDDALRGCGRGERVGITRHAGDEERILKFGSSRSAKLAMDFA